MRRDHRQGVMLALTLAFVPGFVGAQPIARTFDRLEALLKPGDVVAVINNAEQETIGRVSRIAPGSLVLTELVREPLADGTVRWAAGAPRSFSADEITQVLRLDLSGTERIRVYGLPRPFEVAHQKLRAGQAAIVVDTGDRVTVGKVVQISPSSIALALENGDARTFVAAEVKVIKRPGPIWDGAVKGALIGWLVPALAISTNCYTACVPGGFYLLTGGIGAAIGTGIDAAFGPKTVFKASDEKHRVMLTPLVRRDGQALLASIHVR